MSASAASLQCPICFQSGVFNAAEDLRNRLIFVSTNKLSCPVCQEEMLGLDKLTIHLFTHVNLISMKDTINNMQEYKRKSIPESVTSKQTIIPARQKKVKTSGSRNKPTATSTTSNASVKFVKIYPKLPVIASTPIPVIEVARASTEDNVDLNPKFTSIVKTEVINLQENTTCSLCGLQFVDKNILRMHRCLIHNIEDNSNQTISRYDCHLCPKNFKMRGSLMVHLRVAHFGFSSGNSSASKLTEGTTDAETELTSTEKPLIRNDNKQWQCDICLKCFTTKYFLKKHKRLHTGETPYSCAQCNKTFTFQQSYHKHLLYHNDEKPHSCSYCGRAFKELSTLHNHQRIHTGEKPFSCETCGKCFRQRVSYLVHRRIHTGVMPYKCTACNKSFRYKVSQRTHKCQSQPPGTVVRQSGELLEKLKKKHSNQGTSQCQDSEDMEQISENTQVEVSEANAELVRSGAKLSLEDTETENYTLFPDGSHKENIKELDVESSTKNQDLIELFDSNIEQLIDNIPVEENNVPSPSDILQKLCLSQEDDCIESEMDQYSNYQLLKDFL